GLPAQVGRINQPREVGAHLGDEGSGDRAVSITSRLLPLRGVRGGGQVRGDRAPRDVNVAAVVQGDAVAEVVQAAAQADGVHQLAAGIQAAHVGVAVAKGLVHRAVHGELTIQRAPREVDVAAAVHGDAVAGGVAVVVAEVLVVAQGAVG